MYKYLKEEPYYQDTYDLWTIERCLEIVEFWQKKVDFSKLKGRRKKSIIERARKTGAGLDLYFTKGERYRNRDSTIRGWIENDRNLDELVEKAPEPGNVCCPVCSGPMRNTLKQLHGSSTENPRVLFFFECGDCKKRKGVFADGKEYVAEPTLCPKCNKELRFTFKQEGDIEIWEQKCPSCGFMDKEEIDCNQWEEERKAQEKRNRELLRKHRAEFCLSPEEGAEFVVHTNQMRDLIEYMERDKQKKADPAYEKVVSLKRLTIVALEKTLTKALGKKQYMKLSFDKPLIDKHVIVPFTVQDADNSRQERDSGYTLRRILKEALEGTNWRLMSEGVHYRLGYLHGRLKGYEQEDDLMQVIKGQV